MTAFTTTQVETLLTPLLNGRKLVQADVTITNDGTDSGQVTVNSLNKIICWAVFHKSTGDVATVFACSDGTGVNTITVDPLADATGAVLSFLVVGV